jgi:hypothetical protein
MKRPKIGLFHLTRALGSALAAYLLYRIAEMLR